MKVTLVGMIYRSTRYLKFMLENMRRFDAEMLIVANDATPEVQAELAGDGCKWLDYRDAKPDDYYLNRVYRGWNAGAKAAETDTIVFLNSDMWCADGWLDNLLKHFDAKTIPCSRLVESGKLLSGKNAISKDFGRTLDTFRKDAFERYAADISDSKVKPGGLYMPCVFNRNEFLAAGGYPEGNIYSGGVGAKDTRFIRSGDDHFFHHTMAHKKHLTVFNSIAYHFQEGEKDD